LLEIILLILVQSQN